MPCRNRRRDEPWRERNMTLLFILVTGFFLGMQHATEADHLAAVATLASGRHSLAQTMRQGIAWGVGHTLTLMLLGGMVLALGNSIPAGMEQVLELAVALMLIALGLDVLRRLVRQKVHFHVHHHAPETRHAHAHSHAQEASAPKVPHQVKAHDHPHGVPVRGLAVGMMHGMAGSAALILLSLGAVQSVAMGLAYIVVFGLGSIAGMALLSVAIAIPLRLSLAGRLTRLHNALTAAVGLFSCLLGVSIAFRIGSTAGLFL
jgi:ABC-type nickel/cobalt efflux system permease component RcnA